MSNHEGTKRFSLAAITALAGLLIVIVANHGAFPEVLFLSIVTILIGVIVVLVIDAFLWDRTARSVQSKMRRRKDNNLARKHFDDFRAFVERFTSLGEFKNVSQGITGVLQDLVKKATSHEGGLIDMRFNNFVSIIAIPLNDLKQRLNDLYWRKKKEMNYEFLSSLVREFENYVMIHKRLYVDFTVTMAKKIGNISEATRRSYSDYKGDYNQFIIAYTDFAKKCSKERFRIFNENLEKAHEL